MDETLEGAIARLLGRLPASQPSPGPAPAAGPSTRDELVRQALASFDRAQQLLRQGDLARYAQEIERLGQILRQLEKAR